jgi:hypothetical protein
MSTLVGTNPTIAVQDIFSTSPVAPGGLGDSALSDGDREYSLVKAGAVALVPGELIQAPAVVVNHTNLTASVSPIAITGNQTITVTLGATAATLNQYAGGQVVVNAGTGAGYSYNISSHPAAGLSTAVVIKLTDRLQVALDATSRVTLVANRFSGVIQSPVVPTGEIVGVAVSAIAPGEFGFVQTRGIAAVKADATVASVGLSVTRSTTTAGTVSLSTATGTEVGRAIVATVAGEARPVNLSL